MYYNNKCQNIAIYISAYTCYFDYDTLTMYLDLMYKDMKCVKRSFVSGNHVSTVFICNRRVRETRQSGEKREEQEDEGVVRDQPSSTARSVLVRPALSQDVYSTVYYATSGTRKLYARGELEIVRTISPVSCRIAKPVVI